MKTKKKEDEEKTEKDENIEKKKYNNNNKTKEIKKTSVTARLTYKWKLRPRSQQQQKPVNSV